MKEFDVIVIGGGPAGMAAALSAHSVGAKVLLLERDSRLGGILNQCIHNGFGLHYFKEELTGCEYAQRFASLIASSEIIVKLNTMVTKITEDKSVTAVNSIDGVVRYQTKAIVLAMGCRERSGGAIALCGKRPAGVYTAGTAQRLVNIEGVIVGKKVVILGSGDIGLIMARRMTLEGAKVLMVLELQSYSAGLSRNIVQCLQDYNIPLLYSTTITKIDGEERVKGVYYASVDEALKPKFDTEKYIECDTVLLSVGLIPENDLLNGLNIEMDSVTGGAVADDYRQTTVEGIFSCGNVLHVHDLVDNVTLEAELAGKSAAQYAFSGIAQSPSVRISAGENVRYTLPKTVHTGDGKIKIYFRVKASLKTSEVTLVQGSEILFKKRFIALLPGEMHSIELDKTKLISDAVLHARELKI